MAAGRTDSGHVPRFSIVAAVFNVEQYLNEFVASIESQDYSLGDVEIILVDDGSTDPSLTAARSWQQRRPDLVTVLTKENGGQASARNLGLEHAQGEWVTFLDPDDLIEANYLSEIHAFITANPSCALVAANRVLLNDSTGERTKHPLHAHFRDGNQLRDLDKNPQYFHGSAPSAFFRRAVLYDKGIRFDHDIRPNFEDGAFCASYLLAVDRPLVGFVASAGYVYRKRFDGSSTLDRSLLDPDRYTAVLRLGYLALLRRGAEKDGHAPGWLQTQILFDLSWYFSDQDKPSGAQTAAHGAVAAEFHELLAQIVEQLDPGAIASFSLRPYKPVWREIMLHGYRPDAWHTPFVIVDRLDGRQELVRVVYRFTRDRPAEEFLVDGVPVRPPHSKVRDLPYFDRTLLRERIVWLPVGTIRVRLDEQDVEIRTTEPPAPSRSMTRWWIEHKVQPRGAASSARRPNGARDRVTTYRRRAARCKQWALRRVAKARPTRRILARSWVLMDRVHDSDDSAEHLFRYLRKHWRSTNAWFVIEKGTTDYKRLRGAGYRRVVPHGSLRWKLLMLNCEHLISSHADAPVVRPPSLASLIPRPMWRFTFLQHGVIKDDLSAWLNPKEIDVFITSTQDEYDSICGDGTTYRYTTKETKLTGLPRFDEVRKEGRRFPPERRDLILIAPTWRNWLVPPLRAGSQRRELDVAGFLASDFAVRWLQLMTSPALRELAERTGLIVSLLLHPNLQPVVSDLDLPAHIRSYPFEGTNVRELFARSRVLVTDYSSMAFNAAYIDRPVVYFQFDQDRMYGGGHVGQRGYFDHERSGFGPVTVDVGSAVRAMTDAVEYGPDPAPEYQRRIQTAFPLRDGNCCERTATAIRDSTRRVRVPELEASTASGTDAMVADLVADVGLGSQPELADLGEVEVAAPGGGPQPVEPDDVT